MNTQKEDKIQSLLSPNNNNNAKVLKVADLKKIKEEVNNVVNEPVDKIEEKITPVKIKRVRKAKVIEPVKIPEPIVKESAEVKKKELTNSEMLSFAAKGVMSLYQKKISNITEKTSFIYTNISTIFSFLMTVSIPLLMTYLVINKISFISSVASNSTFAMTVVYYAAFYMINSMLFVTGSIVLEGVLNSLKQGVKNLAEIGMNE